MTCSRSAGHVATLRNKQWLAVSVFWLAFFISPFVFVPAPEEDVPVPTQSLVETVYFSKPKLINCNSYAAYSKMFMIQIASAASNHLEEQP